MSLGHNENHHFWGTQNAKTCKITNPEPRQLPELWSSGSSDFGDSRGDFGDSGQDFGHSGHDFGDSGQAGWESRKTSVHGLSFPT